MIFSDPNQLNQVSGRLIALDVGTKRIGIAICDETRLIATPKLILYRQSNQKDFDKIKNLIAENRIVGIVIGWPLTMDGKTQPMSQFVQKFAKNLDEFLEEKLPIILFEERLTSFEARQINASPLSRKTDRHKKNKFVDDIAASLILQHFLQSRN
ncbi:MAG: hypothetical protein A2887_00490 [Alphaproteobacteria bacterium RIFCSPLOWO2_01_FULL_40_26]|nr:MAG: hypothetical protein A3D15_00860 [Alphaproteobacteria bacterium RIFCSPHIGHO2_02_FULL_40_34]OFW85531.1 MAG: hypothetical protein A2794_05030 [Alphaproteobacteria bacterium RIFCSPHIGHO2_01_FULL_40_8]OFW94666.1 MAG: hypothetical protein A2887_00490 [Alphaproteobacteria bacterium RIFCSPLOWO2_01_FULL_40_26]OFX10134.1 MAG: hypothetical protein A3H30_04950 [Alphaproteobacteria bacterium RIFCSPLOWO2_02_FULL_40_19]OFX11763.1 MAG: hypothetical protein A3G22_04540 [Alphaproteobacteria bacterium RI